MTIAIDVVLAILLIISGYAFACFYLNNKTIKDKDFSVLKPTRNKIIYLSISLISVALLVSMFEIVYKVSTIQHIKLLTLVLFMLPISAIDFRLQKIPNQLTLAALAARLLIYIPEFIISPSYAFSVLKDNLIGAVVIGGFFLILLLVFKNSIGMGDIKLFALMGLYQGLWGAVNSVFFSLVASFVLSIGLLITKKKGRKDTISFGPSILVGTIVGMALAGM